MNNVEVFISGGGRLWICMGDYERWGRSKNYKLKANRLWASLELYANKKGINKRMNFFVFLNNYQWSKIYKNSALNFKSI